MILTYDAYNETVTMNQKYEQEIQQMKEQMSHVSEKFDKIDQLARKLGITDDGE
jgi:ribosome assembly protein YihI (activator of Der GTPase)